MEYRQASVETQVTSPRSPREGHTVALLFVYSQNYTTTASKLACALRSASEPSVWVTTACEIHILEPTQVTCRCRGLGTFALFAVARSTITDAEKSLQGVVKVTVGVGGAMCLAATVLQLLSLVLGLRARLHVLLKATTAGTHAAALLTLLECDTRQEEEACPGALGWVCAACWCAGCAALCAQPLLLQAELASRRQRAPSVALLAGVSTLAWLTARLWGGAPLQIGTEAQVVCTAGCAMLTLLCFALAVCAALRLRTLTHKVTIERRTFIKVRQRVVRHTLAVLAATSTTQAAGMWWAQPGPRTMGLVLVLSVAALVNGVTMLVCYVIRDEECLQSVKRVLSLPSHRDWHESPVGDTSLSLYIKQGGEVDSRGGVGMLESNSSPISPATSYWQTPGLESPAEIHRRESTPDTRADIVRCVENKDLLLNSQWYDAHVCHSHIAPAYVCNAHAVCDLIPQAHTSPLRPEYTARVCLQLGVPQIKPQEPAAPLKCSVDFEPYAGRQFDTSKDASSNCIHSNPDVSKITSPPRKSCLKKPKQEFSSSISLPSTELKEESKSKSDIEQVNTEWNKAYNSPETGRILSKISNDLDFLLNKTQNKTLSSTR